MVWDTGQRNFKEFLCPVFYIRQEHTAVISQEILQKKHAGSMGTISYHVRKGYDRRHLCDDVINLSDYLTEYKIRFINISTK